MKTLFTITIVLLTFFACKKKDTLSPTDNCASNYTALFQDEVTTMNNAAQVYATDPTIQNCEAWKAATEDYLNALQGWENCASLTGQKVQWQASIDAAQMSVDAVDCE